MENPYSDLENRIIEVCKSLVLQLRGNNAEDGKALIDLELINNLHELLINYKEQVNRNDLVNKDIVGLLLYTCTRFYLQSKYSKNKDELLKQFERLYSKLNQLYSSTL